MVLQFHSGSTTQTVLRTSCVNSISSLRFVPLRRLYLSKQPSLHILYIQLFCQLLSRCSTPLCVSFCNIMFSLSLLGCINTTTTPRPHHDLGQRSDSAPPEKLFVASAKVSHHLSSNFSAIALPLGYVRKQLSRFIFL